MAKVTTADGTVFEGSNEELMALFKQMGVKFPEDETLEVEFKAGEYVETLTTSKLGFYSAGRYGKVRRVTEKGDVSVDFTDGGNGLYKPTDLKRLSKQEVELIKAEIEEKEAQRKLEDKWAKIGRKANEYKKGDIVRVKQCVGVVPVGSIGEIGEHDDELFRVNTFEHKEGNWHSSERIELITPVEARFDR